MFLEYTCSLNVWWYQICKNCNFKNEITVILGHIGKCCHNEQINYIVLKAKWYIYRTKYLEKPCFFMEFLSELKYHLRVEELNLTKIGKYGKFLEIWYKIATTL